MESIIISSKEDLNNFKEFYSSIKSDIGVVAFDLETDGVNESTALIYGIGISFDINEDEGYYFPVRDKHGNLVHSDYPQYKLIQTILSENKIIGHNIIYDTLVWKHNTLNYIADHIHADTILMKHTINEERPFGLKEVAVEYLGEWADKAQQELLDNIKKNGGSTTKTNLQMFKADTEVLGKYCTWDVMLTMKLYKLFSQKLKEENLEKLFYEDEIMPLYKEVTIPMKLKGINIDVAYFKNLLNEINTDIELLGNEVVAWLEENLGAKFESYVMQLLNEKAPVKTAGGFPRYLAMELGEVLPDSLAKKTLEKFSSLHTVQWLLGHEVLAGDILFRAQLRMFFDKNEQNHVFNIGSKEHLKMLFFDILGEDPISKTEKGEPQVDDDFLDSIKTKYAFVPMLQDWNKLNKIKGTYIEGILDRQIDGIVYTSMLQFGTTSGRYSSTAPNLQNLPRPKEDDAGLSELILKYNNAIRAGFIAAPGYKFIDTDYSALEPRCFSHMSGSKDLQRIFHEGTDMYSAIAIQMFNIADASAKKKDDNFLGKLYPEKRQQVKAFCFAKDTKVELTTGVANIQDIRIGDYIKTAQGYKKVINTMRRSSDSVAFVTNRGGFICTPDHKIWNVTKQDFIEAKNFNKQDEIEFTSFNHNWNSEGIEQKLPVYSIASLKNSASRNVSEITFDENWAYLLGAFLGDGVGSYTARKTNRERGYNSHLLSAYVGICGLQEDLVVKKWANLISEYGFNGNFVLDKRRDNNFGTFNIHHTELVSLFVRSFLALQEGGKVLKIHPFVFNSPINVKLSFIAGLLDTDGYLKHNHSKGYSDVAFCSQSIELTSDFVTLLNTIGVASSMRAEYNKKYNKYYYLCILHRNGIYQLNRLGLQRFLICPRKKEAIEKQIEPAVHREKKNTFQCTVDNGLIDVYDITVEDVHEFYANGIRVHNCLAVVYGAESFRIADLLGITREEAQELINMYLNAFPDLKNYIQKCHYEVNTYGKVSTSFGRLRHLEEGRKLYKMYGHQLLDGIWAKRNKLQEERRRYKNLLNNSTNFKIQGLAAHIINKAMIKIARDFKANNIDGWVTLMIHDQVVCSAKEQQIDKAKTIVQNAMENIVKLDVPLVAEPAVAYNLRDGH